MLVFVCFSPRWDVSLHMCANMDIDNPNAIDGAPCAVQLVGRNMHEEELLRNAEVVARVLGH